MTTLSAPAGRFVCIHGHFYQPPRENPWLEAVETQDSAAPYHDWNARITAECYATNGAARIMNGANRIVRITNNYARMSFNFGPTLLSWLEENAPLTYRNIVDADHRSRARYGGHGSALAQVYNHTIMPLASARDRELQIAWGIADFKHRFGRDPEGMWLAETAVDTATLDALARQGIRFTLLAPHQCARVRPLRMGSPAAGESHGVPALPAAPETPWTETPNAFVDSTRPYLVRLPEGRSIAVFFYNGPASRAIAFEGLLNSGDAFAARLAAGFHPGNPGPQLVHVATDGESYGHHHRHGEMALAYAMDALEAKGLAQLTNYGEFLERFPPEWEAQIQDATSWSCFHGVERWRSDCGCNGGRAGWNQRWRAPLRTALDTVAAAIAPAMEKAAAELFVDPERARLDYIKVVLRRTSQTTAQMPRRRAGERRPARDQAARAVDAFLERHGRGTLPSVERTRALQLMEIERHLQLMYTSCGWFFDELSGIETVQILAYAARALALAAEALPLRRQALEELFLAELARAESNVAAWPDGSVLYRKLLRPMEVGLEQVAAHFAISSVFSDEGRRSDELPLFCYRLTLRDEEILPYGHGQLRVGHVRVSSTITEEVETAAYAVLHFGDQNLTAAVKRHAPEEDGSVERLRTGAARAIAEANLPEVVRLIDACFGESRYSLTSLFTDEQRRIMDRILRPATEEVESSLSEIYAAHAGLLSFMSHTGLPKPASLAIAAQVAINAQLRAALEADRIDADRVLALLERARVDMVVIDLPTLSYIADGRMRAAMLELERAPGDPVAGARALQLARVFDTLPLELNLWQAQNIWYGLWRRHVTRQEATPESEESVALFRELGERLSMDLTSLALPRPQMGASDLKYPDASNTELLDGAAGSARPREAEFTRSDPAVPQIESR